jgi:hypothetical protein
MRSFRIPGIRCPACNAPLDGASGPRAPQPEDLTLCVYCFAVARYAVRESALILVALTPEELAALPAPLRRMLDRVRQDIEEKRRRSMH